jgi:hypothetical protein
MSKSVSFKPWQASVITAFFVLVATRGTDIIEWAIDHWVVAGLGILAVFTVLDRIPARRA